MTPHVLALALTGVLTLAPGALLACEVSQYGPGEAAPPPSFGANCSFTVPHHLTPGAGISGTPTVNIGGGRIGQRVSQDSPCGYSEEVWILDCNSGEQIGIAGPTEAGGNFNGLAELLYPPHGTLRLSPETTVPDIAAMADSGGYTHWPDILARLYEIRRVSDPDLPSLTQLTPACGCRMFYPDSPGASQ